jgi:hypothetical protein
MDLERWFDGEWQRGGRVTHLCHRISREQSQHIKRHSHGHRTATVMATATAGSNDSTATASAMVRATAGSWEQRSTGISSFVFGESADKDGSGEKRRMRWGGGKWE